MNHIDTAPSYGDAELRIGPWMDRHRDAFFLATKTDQWSFEGAKAQVRRSLERLRTDRIDLLQLHALTHPDDWEQALSPGQIERITLTPNEQGTLDVQLYGDLAQILQFCEMGEHPRERPGRGGPGRGLSVVAGVRFGHWFTPPIEVPLVRVAS